MKHQKPLDFQSIMLTLEHFWAERGCLIWQPYYSQVGAGTMNPGTFLRVLGPEPWNVGYVEPSVRPDDGRYGENPNRLQMHYQFQVILKPDPGNPQELYLQSLEALGIDPRQHDIRFVEDNWESPALGAWGLGWEVWLDGQEITQFTYFQQAGGFSLDPVSVELTYGLERIAMTLQRVRNFREIRWDENRTYGDVNLQAEQEHSRYYFEIAQVERLRQMFDLFEAEAEASIAAGLVLPAHDYILKCSHTFNVMDARGAIGVTERQALFGRMRELAHRVAAAYLDQRQQMEYPWLKEISKPSDQPARAAALAKDIGAVTSQALKPGDFLLEIGTEELPPGDLRAALEQLRAKIPAWLEELRLSHEGEVSVLGTPRRLVVWVPKLAARQPDREVIHRGPPASRAFDPAGAPTQAAVGFARSKGVEVSALEVREIDGGRYAVARVYEPGRPALRVLSEALPGWIAALRFDKSMRWNASNVAFSRPIRWLVALLGDQVVPFEYAGLQSGRRTRGLRFHEPESFELAAAGDYFAALRQQGILLDPQERRQTIAAQVGRLIEEAGGQARLDEELLDEVTQLVEAPMALRGSFEETHLHLPPEVIISVMKKHQRYFPVQRADGSLMAHFIAVRNGDGQHLDIVTDGNEQVIRARFADAAFFLREDLKHHLEDLLPRLDTLMFQFKLGSMRDKSQRVERLVERLAPLIGLAEPETAVARRAAELCKADLVSHMVIEMTSLQGIMGRYYALHSGEPEAVAQAILEHYLPRFSGDALPRSKAGLLVGLADRLDSLTGLFAAGLAPSGTKDPFAQRRAALGLVQNLIAWNLPFDLRQGLSAAAENLPIEASAQSLAECLEFIAGRLRSLLIEQGYRYDVVDAVLAAQAHNPASAAAAVKELSAWVSRPDWMTILPAYARCVRITREFQEQFAVRPAIFQDPVEDELYQAVTRAQAARRKAGSADDFFQAFLPLIPIINRYFEVVLVMSEDAEQRTNRLGLLQKIAALPADAANLSLLEGF